MAIATNSTILNILINGDASGAIRALDQAGGAAQSAGDKFAAVGGKLTAGVTVPLLAVGAAGVQAASNLNEAASKVDVVFGSAQGTVENFAESAAENFGLSERAALEAAGTLGNLVVSMGGTQDAAAAMSVDLLGLAGDLASFNNLDTDDVLEKIRSGLVGEIEPLRSLGVNFDAATVSARALTIAQGEGRNVATEADKVMARYNLILEQTTTAQGDFARTSDGLANQQRIASAELENSAAALGQRLLPAAADATKMIADLAGWFAHLPGPVQDTVVKVGLAAAAIGPLVFIGGKLITTVTTLRTSMATLGGNAGAFGVAALSVGLFVMAISEAEREAAVAQQQFEELSDAMSGGFDSSVLQGNLEDWEVTLEQLGTNATEVGTALTGGEDAWQAFIDSFIARQDSVDDQAAALWGLNVIVEGYREQIDRATQAQETHLATMRRHVDEIQEEDIASGKATDSMVEYVGIHRAAADTFSDLNRETSEYIGLLAEIQGATTNTADAQIAVFDAIDSVAQAIVDNGPVLDVATEAGRRNTEEVEALAESYVTYAQALADAKAPQEEVNNALAYGRESVRGVLEQFGVAPQYIDAYLTELGLIPQELKTDILVQTPPTPKLRGFGEEMVLEVSGGISDRAASVVEAFIGLLEDVVDGGDGQATAFEEVGRALADGIATGIGQGLGGVQAAVGSLIHAGVQHGKDVAGIHSPSQLFADEVGAPISEGIAQGILDTLGAPQSAVNELFDSIMTSALSGASSVIGGIGNVLGTWDAENQLQDAREALMKLRADGAPEEELSRAEERLTRAQLGTVRAQQALIEAGQDWIDQGPNAEENFRRIAAAAGLSADEIDRQIAVMQEAVKAAQSIGLLGDATITTADPAAAAQAALDKEATRGVFRSRLAGGNLGAIADYTSGGDEARYNQALDSYTDTYFDLAYSVGQDFADRLASQNLSVEQFALAGRAAMSAGGTTNTITINMPPGSDGNDVVAALSQWTRQNGPLSGAVNV